MNGFRRFIVLAFLASASCAGEPATDRSESSMVIEDSGAQDTPPPAPPPKEFVVVHRNKKLFVAPDDGSEFLQYRTQKAQEKYETKEKERAQKRLEKRTKKYQKEIEREKKRLKRIKDPDDREAYVLKRRDSRARRDLKASKKRARSTKEGHPNARFMVGEIIEDRGDWLKIRTLSESEAKGHCYDGGLPGLKTLKLDVWVQRDDLDTVTVRREAFQVWRGSEIKIAPGVALAPDGRKRHIASIDGFRFRLEVPRDARSDRYTARGFFEAPYTDATFTDIALAEGLLKIDRQQYLPYNPYFGLFVTGTLWVGKRFYATAQTPCGEYTIHAKEEYLEGAGRRGALRLRHGDKQVKPPWVAAKSQVFDTKKESIGVTVKDTRVFNETKAPSGFRCFQQPVWPKKSKRSKRPSSHKFTLCFEATSVSDEAQ